MKNKSPAVEAFEIRQRAEARVTAKTPPPGSSSAELAAQRMLHELQVHQIELELQNAELRQARDQVEAALEQYNDLYDFAPAGYLTLDRDGNILALNLAGAGLLGRERALLLGRRLGQFLDQKERALFGVFLGRVFAGGAKETRELALLAGDGQPLYVQVEAVAAASGRECRVVMIDISARKQSEADLAELHAKLASRAAQLASANSGLAAANSELEAFNFTVSHDLCTPLTTISGYCQVLIELCQDRLDAEALGYLAEVCQSTQRMKQLIASLLDFSRVARVALSREHFNLSQMAQAVAAGLNLEAPGRQANFRIAQGITGHGDAELWRIVLENLMSNAWKFSAGKEETVISFGMKQVAGASVFFVQDNGPGFDMAHAGKLFVPFQRIPGTQVSGHGIGLATVERIVTRHGGRIWAESTPGEGATFFFTMK